MQVVELHEKGEYKPSSIFYIGANAIYEKLTSVVIGAVNLRLSANIRLPHSVPSKNKNSSVG